MQGYKCLLQFFRALPQVKNLGVCPPLIGFSRNVVLENGKSYSFFCINLLKSDNSDGHFIWRPTFRGIVLPHLQRRRERQEINQREKLPASFFMIVSFMACTSSLNMEIIRYFETSANFCYAMWDHLNKITVLSNITFRIIGFLDFIHRPVL
jgi:hypothetical protein